MKEIILAIVLAILGSGAFWTFLQYMFQKRLDKKDNQQKLLVGLGHDRIIELGQQYIERGWLTEAEYENLNDYLYLPYKTCGGNGTAEKIMNEVKKLPIRDPKYGG